MSRFKARAEGKARESGSQKPSQGVAVRMGLSAIAYALLWIGEILEKYLKQIAKEKK